MDIVVRTELCPHANTHAHNKACTPLLVPSEAPRPRGSALTTTNARLQTQVRCAADPTLKLGGKYFMDCAEAGTSGPGMDMAAAARLWKVSEELTGASFGV
jgi:hypothetical protein